MNSVAWVIVLSLINSHGPVADVEFQFESKGSCENFAIFHLEDSMKHYQSGGLLIKMQTSYWCQPIEDVR